MFVRSGVQADHRWRVALLTEHFGSALVVGHGVVNDAAALPGLVCLDSAGHRAGALSYRIATANWKSCRSTPRHIGEGPAPRYSRPPLMWQGPIGAIGDGW